MTNKVEVTFGSDPELHIFDKEKKRIVSAIPVVKTDKHNPISLGDGINMYADNVLVETTFPPVNNKQDFIKRFQTAFARIQKHLGDRYSLVPKAAHVYHDDELKDPKAWEIGCTNNYNAYSVSVNETISFTNNLRTGSCHLHVGNQVLTDFETRINTIKLLDVILGCSSVIFDKDKTSKARRQYYGSASEHRPTPFGLEYRVLSPFVLNSPDTVELAFDLINHALKHVFDGSMPEVLKLVNADTVRKSINECNRKLAEQVLNKVSLPKDLMSRIKARYNTNFYKNWKL